MAIRRPEDGSALVEAAIIFPVLVLMALAVAFTTQCPYCIRGHTQVAMRKGATEQEIVEAIWVAAEMRAGAAYAHSVIAIDAMHPDRSA